jgi:hypothetical protein
VFVAEKISLPEIAADKRAVAASSGMTNARLPPFIELSVIDMP